MQKTFGFRAIQMKLLVILVICSLQHSEGARLARSLTKPTLVPEVETLLINESSHSSFKIMHHRECICPLGQYWHWISKSCVKQGGLGHECGHFQQVDHRVCQEGFVCKAPEAVSPNVHDVPSTCKPCTAGDKCESAEKRHEALCVKAVKVTGNTCSAVQVSLPPATAGLAPAGLAPAGLAPAAPAPAPVAAALPGQLPATAGPAIEACLDAIEARSLLGFADKQRSQTEKDAFEMIFAARAASFKTATAKATAATKKMDGPGTGSVASATAVVGAAATTTTTTIQMAVSKNGLIVASGNSSFTISINKTCPCPLGMFWHTISKACVKQGGFGYECGFFPEAYQHRVCQDGLTCKKLEHVQDNYASHGIYDFAGTQPATCKPCTAEDKCKTGKGRYDAACPKHATVIGTSCSTVHVLSATKNEKETADAANKMFTGEVCISEEKTGIDLGFQLPLSDGMDVKLISMARAKVFMIASSQARAKAEEAEKLAKSSKSVEGR